MNNSSIFTIFTIFTILIFIGIILLGFNVPSLTMQNPSRITLDLLQNSDIYYNNTHAYITTLDGKHYVFAHDANTLPLIKKYHSV